MTTISTWKCDVCGYVHKGAAPPEHCPVCSAGAEMFSPLDVGVLAPAPIESSATAAANRTIAIIGAGVAGVSAAEQARATDPGASIALFSGEPDLPYLRLNLTRLLAREVDEASLLLQPRGWFAQQRIELVHDRVAAIDCRAHKLILQSGNSQRYDRLVLANGAHPFVPPLPGVARRNVMPLRSKAQALELLRLATRGPRIVCLGGGLLGLEAAGALARHGAQVTVLENYGWLLPRQLAEPAGKLLIGHVERQGIAVRCSVRVEEIVGDEEVAGVRLAGGEEIPADVVLLATGVRPNATLARRAGLEVKAGVRVDDRLATSDADIFAAGDVAEHRGVVPGIWPTAYAQGVVAGANAAGANAEYRPLPPSNQLKVLAVNLFSIGEVAPGDASSRVFEQTRDDIYFRLVCRGGVLVGANLYGDVALASTIKKAVEQRTPLVDVAPLHQRFPELSTVVGMG